jgi:hypothetical protein
MCDHVIVILISTHWVLVTDPKAQPTQGNVGKSPGKFIWKKLRHGEQSPIIYSNVSTTSTVIQRKRTRG